MKEFTSMRERMAVLRKKNKAFHSNMIDKLKKMHEKHSVYEQRDNSDDNNAHPEATWEHDDNEIVYKPQFHGHLKGGD